MICLQITKFLEATRMFYNQWYKLKHTAWFDCRIVAHFILLCHMHLSTSKINHSPHKLSFQNTMQAGDQKLRYDLVWP